ncbi:hypothetical protein [Endozoicomonas elysicola]|uniref:hypothetical protein n=1 Tax=Endozoicomonas elysicola TaxID=305900 RepID=UPI0003668B14|nr:hypothetical protein [Endozoicomonas elysicola]
MWKYVPNWHSLKSLGKSKVIRSSYWWLFLVPMLAKVFEATGDEILVTILNATFKITLKLPFSWSLFYFSAVCFAAASLIYLVRCPQMIDAYESFEDWEKSGRDQTSLIRGFLFAYRDDAGMAPNIISDKTKDYFLKHHLKYTGDCSKITKESLTPMSVIKTGIPKENLKATYYYVFDTYKVLRSKARLLMFVFYTIGFSCFLLVLVQNFIYVCKYL